MICPLYKAALISTITFCDGNSIYSKFDGHTVCDEHLCAMWGGYKNGCLLKTVPTTIKVVKGAT